MTSLICDQIETDANIVIITTLRDFKKTDQDFVWRARVPSHRDIYSRR